MVPDSKFVFFSIASKIVLPRPMSPQNEGDMGSHLGSVEQVGPIDCYNVPVVFLLDLGRRRRRWEG